MENQLYLYILVITENWEFLHQFHPWKEFWLAYILDLHPLCQIHPYKIFLKYFQEKYWFWEGADFLDKSKKATKAISMVYQVTHLYFTFNCVNKSMYFVHHMITSYPQATCKYNMTYEPMPTYTMLIKFINFFMSSLPITAIC